MWVVDPSTSVLYVELSCSKPICRKDKYGFPLGLYNESISVHTFFWSRNLSLYWYQNIAAIEALCYVYCIHVWCVWATLQTWGSEGNLGCLCLLPYLRQGLWLLTTMYARLAGSRASGNSPVFASVIEACWDYRCRWAPEVSHLPFPSAEIIRMCHHTQAIKIYCCCYY